MNLLHRIGIIESRISDCDRPMALDALQRRLDAEAGGYVCFTSVHGAVMGRQDAAFREITNGSFLSLADGKPLYWLGRFKGAQFLAHLPGPDFMLDILRRFPEEGHFFYGSTPQVLSQLEDGLKKIVPGLRICGTLSPPYRPLTGEDRQEHYAAIKASGARFAWVGLGAPKQEQWMAQAWRELSPALLFGVGAAFDFYAGTVRRAPAALRSLGLEWLYRLCQEPRRLWRRYLVTNSLFIGYALGEAFSDRRT